MAKKAKYTEDDLLTAVIRYSEVYFGPIRPKDLAEWAGKNIPELEGVRYYHFTRPLVSKNKKGDPVETRRKCMEEIERLNLMRETTIPVSINPVLQSSSLEKFHEMNRSQQEMVILEARASVRRIASENAVIKKENAFLREENEKLREQQEKHGNDAALIAKLDIIMKQLVKKGNEKELREALASIGIEDGGFDLKKYMESLKEKKEFRFDTAIQESDTEDDLDMMGGFDFDE